MMGWVDRCGNLIINREANESESTSRLFEESAES